MTTHRHSCQGQASFQQLAPLLSRLCAGATCELSFKQLATQPLACSIHLRAMLDPARFSSGSPIWLAEKARMSATGSNAQRFSRLIGVRGSFKRYENLSA